MKTWRLGQSVEGRDFEVHGFAPGDQSAGLPETLGTASWPWVLYLGGVHGDEVEGVWLLEAAIERWKTRFPASRVGALVWPRAKPDGIAAGRRWNAHDIDLNRNLPSKDWTPEIKNPRYPPGPAAGSEPESQALVELLKKARPRAILSAHSFARYQVNVNGPAREWAEALAPLCGYPITEDIGYPTPGSLGSYSGMELVIPTVTLEIERGLAREEVLRLHNPVIEASLQFWEKEQ